MSQETLKWFRLTVPGVMILIALYVVVLPFYERIAAVLGTVPGWNGLNIRTELVISIVATVLGGFYHVFDVRWPFLRKSLGRIHNHIKDQLLAPFEDDETIAHVWEELREGRTLLHILYRFIDNDESLTQKAKRVYFNGLLLSTAADAMAVSVMSTVMSLLLYVVSGRAHYGALTIVFAVMYVFSSRIILPRVTKTHIELVTDQLEFILLHYRPELHTRLERAASTQE
jgi:hypothetical protein